MKRWHLFEFNDSAWVPANVKALVTDYLRTLGDITRPFSPQLPLITQALQHAGKDPQVIDLCSGSGGPWQYLSPQLDRLVRRRVPVTLTDKYPNHRAAALPENPTAMSWCPESVDATAVPASLRGMRTLFNSFHHFKPPAARHILASAVAHDEPIVVMEMLRRSWLDLLLVLFTPLLVWLITPWIRPFSWSRLIFTYVVPVAPLIIAWDTLVSILRCYTPAEMQGMGQAVAGGQYEWFSGAYRHSRVSVTFLVGYPLTGDNCCEMADD